MASQFKKSITQLLDILFEAAELSNSSIHRVIRDFTADRLAEYMEERIRNGLETRSPEYYSELDRLSRKWTQQIISDVLRLRRIAMKLGDQEKKLLIILLLGAVTSAMLESQSNDGKEISGNVK